MSDCPPMNGCARLIAVIPARGGSKSIPRKNVRDFLGKPLVAWTIQVAKESGIFEKVILSTDDEQIGRIGSEYGASVPFLRPRELALDTTPTGPVIRHAVEWLHSCEGWTPDLVMVLEPTSPGRRPFHICEAARLLWDSGADSVASVSEVPHHYVPPKVLDLRCDGTIVGINGTLLADMVHRRQDLPTYYFLNGLIFSCRIEWVLKDPPTLWGDKVLAYLVAPKYSIDLDTLEDWIAAEARVRRILSEEGNSRND